MKILGIESSCDESAVALIEVTHHISNKQSLLAGNMIHKRILDQYITTHNNHNYGGIIPESVARQHYYYLPKMIARLKENHDFRDIDMVCASHSPGLIGGLMLGTCTGKAIATALNKPFYPIHHIEGHILSPTFENKGLCMSYICLIASGGHTLLAIVEDFGKYKILGQSADDAMGELFDKVAKYLGLPFPGGPEVERLASLGTPKYTLPIPKIKDNEYGFSFSGLKTAILKLIHDVANDHAIQTDCSACNPDISHNDTIQSLDRTIHTCSKHNATNQASLNLKAPVQSLSSQDMQDICASVQYTLVQICKQKFSVAMRDFPHINHYVMAGGVGANKAIRNALDQLMEANNKKFFVPEMKLCTDNALMIAWTGYLSMLYARKPDLNASCMNTKSIAEITNEYDMLAS